MNATTRTPNTRPEPITNAEVAAIVEASGGRWDEPGVRKYADEFVRTFGRADALRRLTEAALDPTARTPRAAEFTKYDTATRPTPDDWRDACRECGLPLVAPAPDPLRRHVADLLTHQRGRNPRGVRAVPREHEDGWDVALILDGGFDGWDIDEMVTQWADALAVVVRDLDAEEADR